MTNEEIIEESRRLRKQAEKVIKLTYVILIFTIIAYIILIFLKLGGFK